MRARAFVIASMVVCVAGCGSNPADPDGGSSGGGTSNGCFAIVGNHGSISATISGLSNFTGIIPTGQNIRTPSPIPAGAFFTIQATNVSDGTSVLVSGPLKTGTTNASLTDPDGQVVQVLVTTRSCTAGTGSWSASATTGTASVSLTSASATGASGSFTATATPSPGSPTGGNKTVSGTFSATF
jgi:hypothetical protein